MTEQLNLSMHKKTDRETKKKYEVVQGSGLALLCTTSNGYIYALQRSLLKTSTMALDSFA
jgi:hypothetical protein